MSGSGVGDILVSVKIEREENGASTVGLYAEHEVKAELVLGPEQMQLQHVGSANQSDNCVTTGSARVKDGWGGAGWCALELGLKLEWGGEPRHQDIAFNITQSQNLAETCAIKQERAETESPRRAPSAAQQPSAPRDCSVALQSTLLEKLLHKCTICSRTFLHKSSLTTHPCIESNDKVSKVISKTERLYICDSCKKHFAFKKDLIRHLKIHSSVAERFLKNSTCPRECKNKMYPCDICKKKFQKYYLNQHVLVHTRDKPYSCDICQKTYRQRSLLIQHKLIHTGNKPYTCDICKKAFIDRSNFMRHKLAHTTDKPYACHICHKTFKHRYSLNNHQVVHTGEKFVCEICNKSFTERSSVNRHLSIHSGERPYACDVCPKTFRRRSHFKSHMQTHGPLGCTVTNVNL